jgi:phenylpropionate dioxygenase-like ring-hydroxylating dioxygenase large terminal subunit
LLGEDLIAFRDSENRVGLVEARCPHRGANLFFGRNEDCGIRCAYHGWKFDVDGNCLEIPTMPRDAAGYENLRERVKITAYPTREWGDYVWAFLGPPDKTPALPDMEFALVPPAHRFVTKKLQECNWAQAAEGGIDTAHFSFLHAPVSRNDDAIGTLTRGYAPQTMGQDQIRWMLNDGAPRYTVEKHDAGAMPTATTSTGALPSTCCRRTATRLALPGARRITARPGCRSMTRIAGSTPTRGTRSGRCRTRSGRPMRTERRFTPRWTRPTCRCATAATTI